MHIPPQVSFSDLVPSAAVDARIRENVGELGQLDARIDIRYAFRRRCAQAMGS